MPLASRCLLVMAAPFAACSPNLVYLLADDLGINEVGFMNATRGLSTPRLDALAASGIILDNYYVLPICSPTRSALMTGRYPVRLGTHANVIFWDTPWAVSREHTFFPEALQRRGYLTAKFGKWHLGMFRDEFLPTRRGFNRSAGYLQGCEAAFTHVAACCEAATPAADEGYVCPHAANDTSKDYRGYDWWADDAPDLAANGTKSSQLIVETAGEFLEMLAATPAAARPPYFLYLPFQNVHAPYTTLPRFRAAFDNDTALTDDEKTMFGYISELDAAVAAVVDAQASLGLADDTLVVFSSDNGAPSAAGVRGRNWPLRGFKSQLWEGGVKVAGFVAGSLVPPPARGSRFAGLMHVVDWFPTLLGRAAGGGAPAARSYALDGVDQWDALVVGAPSARDRLLYNINPLCEGGQAAAPKAGVRVGDYKLLAYCYAVAGVAGANATGPRPPADGAWPASWPGSARNSSVVLFDLAADPRETTDLSAEQPSKVDELLDALRDFAAVTVEPMQWVPPFQGDDYECAACPLRNATGPYEPWAPWM